MAADPLGLLTMQRSLLDDKADVRTRALQSLVLRIETLTRNMTSASASAAAAARLLCEEADKVRKEWLRVHVAAYRRAGLLIVRAMASAALPLLLPLCTDASHDGTTERNTTAAATAVAPKEAGEGGAVTCASAAAWSDTLVCALAAAVCGGAADVDARVRLAAVEALHTFVRSAGVHLIRLCLADVLGALACAVRDRDRALVVLADDATALLRSAMQQLPPMLCCSHARRQQQQQQQEGDVVCRHTHALRTCAPLDVFVHFVCVTLAPYTQHAQHAQPCRVGVTSEDARVLHWLLGLLCALYDLPHMSLVAYTAELTAVLLSLSLVYTHDVVFDALELGRRALCEALRATTTRAATGASAAAAATDDEDEDDTTRTTMAQSDAHDASVVTASHVRDDDDKEEAADDEVVGCAAVSPEQMRATAAATRTHTLPSLLSRVLATLLATTMAQLPCCHAVPRTMRVCLEWMTDVCPVTIALAMATPTTTTRTATRERRCATTRNDDKSRKDNTNSQDEDDEDDESAAADTPCPRVCDGMTDTTRRRLQQLLATLIARAVLPCLAVSEASVRAAAQHLDALLRQGLLLRPATAAAATRGSSAVYDADSHDAEDKDSVNTNNKHHGDGDGSSSSVAVMPASATAHGTQSARQHARDDAPHAQANTPSRYRHSSSARQWRRRWWSSCVCADATDNYKAHTDAAEAHTREQAERATAGQRAVLRSVVLQLTAHTLRVDGDAVTVLAALDWLACVSRVQRCVVVDDDDRVDSDVARATLRLLAHADVTVARGCVQTLYDMATASQLRAVVDGVLRSVHADASTLLPQRLSLALRVLQQLHHAHHTARCACVLLHAAALLRACDDVRFVVKCVLTCQALLLTAGEFATLRALLREACVRCANNDDDDDDDDGRSSGGDDEADEAKDVLGDADETSKVTVSRGARADAAFVVHHHLTTTTSTIATAATTTTAATNITAAASTRADKVCAQTVFVRLFEVWCCNAVSALSLCLLSGHYTLARDVCAYMAHSELSASTLVQLDRLAQLLEGPVFTTLRVRLVQPPVPGALVDALLAVLAMLPQSSPQYRALYHRVKMGVAVSSRRTSTRCVDDERACVVTCASCDDANARDEHNNNNNDEKKERMQLLAVMARVQAALTASERARVADDAACRLRTQLAMDAAR